MAEILISLTIIGVIAAITLPALQANINEKAWATQRKALYNRMSQAISMMPSLNGYGEYSGAWDEDNGNASVISDTAALTFVTNGLSNVLQISNICTVSRGTSSEDARNEFKKCGIPAQYKSMLNVNKSFPTRLSELNPTFFGTYETTHGVLTNPQRAIDTRAATFVTKNNESIAVFYNPNCISYDQRVTNYTNPVVYNSYYPQPHMCADFIYDLNGLKGPNKVGKDIGFITAMYPTDSVVVAPMPLNVKSKTTLEQTATAAACRTQDKDSRVPNIEELQAMFVNRLLLGTGAALWSSSVSGSDTTKAWYMQVGQGVLGLYRRSGKFYVWCIKR